ncbi:MAG: DUF3850 domain-containing protein [Patescibacteria group bacterium]|nr:DUF3850 domain-containing protein [Patescibacteria group bacterium]
MREHLLKTVEPWWSAVECGSKQFEVRRDDRGFALGDVLILRRFDPLRPTMMDADRADVRKRVSYILPGGQFGIEEGYVVMGLEDAD